MMLNSVRSRRHPWCVAGGIDECGGGGSCVAAAKQRVCQGHPAQQTSKVLPWPNQQQPWLSAGPNRHDRAHSCNSSQHVNNSTSQAQHDCSQGHTPRPAPCCMQDTALTSLKVSAQLCGELLAECHAAPPEALLTAAMQLHDHALLVSTVCH